MVEEAQGRREEVHGQTADLGPLDRREQRDDLSPEYRSRLVAREIRRFGEEPVVAPTPPLESLRTILSFAATDLPGRPAHVRDPDSERRTQISFIDIKRAYLCAKTDPDDPTYVELPPEHPWYKDGESCGLLLKHMYGTRKAGDGWHVEISATLTEKLGFTKGDASACIFRHPERSIECSIHGDDLSAQGPKIELDWYKQELEKTYELKEGARLGPGPTDDKESRMLNRIVRWTEEGIEYEADPRQSEQLVRDLGMSGSKSVGTPGVPQTSGQISMDRELSYEKQRPYRGVAARSNYLSADRPDMQHAAKEVCRWMSTPTEAALVALKRIGRYLEGHGRLVYKYVFQEASMIDCYSDTDWAGCPRTRRSTSWGCLMLGKHLIKSWSTTHGPISLSSGEAEFYGVVKASSVALGYQAMMEDLGQKLEVRVWTDSTATMGICGRRGLGKLRHIDTQCLWIQQKVRGKAIELRKIRGEMNPADLFTKHLLGEDKVKSLVKLLECEFRGGRAATAPKLRDAEAGPTKELLAAEQEEYFIEHEGQEFPAMEYEGEFVVEAFIHEHDKLPHLHSNLEKLFPKAVASAEEREAEDVTPCGFERRGEELGKAGCVLKATSTTTTTTTKPANDGGHDCSKEEKEKKKGSGGKKQVRFDLSSS